MKASEFGGKVPESVGKWFFNRRADGEVWSNPSFATKEEAIAEGRENFGDDAAFYVGVGAEISIRPTASDEMIERLSETAYEECGDAGEDYLYRLSPELRTDLDDRIEKAVGEWLTQNELWPAICKIEQIEEVRPLQEVDTLV